MTDMKASFFFPSVLVDEHCGDGFLVLLLGSLLVGAWMGGNEREGGSFLFVYGFCVSFWFLCRWE